MNSGEKPLNYSIILIEAYIIASYACFRRQMMANTHDLWKLMTKQFYTFKIFLIIRLASRSPAYYISTLQRRRLCSQPLL